MSTIIELLLQAKDNFASHKSVTPDMAWRGIRSDMRGLLDARTAFRREYDDTQPYNRKAVFAAFDRAVAKATPGGRDGE